MEATNKHSLASSDSYCVPGTPVRAAIWLLAVLAIVPVAALLTSCNNTDTESCAGTEQAVVCEQAVVLR